MADDDATALGAIADQLGMKAFLDPGEQITDAIMIVKVVNANEPGEAHPQVLFSPGTDAITRTGLYYAAQDSFAGQFDVDEERYDD